MVYTHPKLFSPHCAGLTTSSYFSEERIGFDCSGRTKKRLLPDVSTHRFCPAAQSLPCRTPGGSQSNWRGQAKQKSSLLQVDANVSTNSLNSKRFFNCLMYSINCSHVLLSFSLLEKLQDKSLVNTGKNKKQKTGHITAAQTR